MSLLNLSTTTRTRQCNTPSRLASTMYDGIKQRCTRFNRTIDITKDEFVTWLVNNPDFQTLHNIYVASGYVTYYRPSIDRKDDSKGYTTDNMQLTDWRGNLSKELYGNDLLTQTTKVRTVTVKHMKRSSSIPITRASKPVVQCDKEGTYITEYESPSRAQDATGCHRGNIAKVCNGIGKTVGGYIWKWA
jgi:hypothetical protein